MYILEKSYRNRLIFACLSRGATNIQIWQQCASMQKVYGHSGQYCETESSPAAPDVCLGLSCSAFHPSPCTDVSVKNTAQEMT